MEKVVDVAPGVEIVVVCPRCAMRRFEPHDENARLSVCVAPGKKNTVDLVTCSKFKAYEIREEERVKDDRCRHLIWGPKGLTLEPTGSQNCKSGNRLNVPVRSRVHGIFVICISPFWSLVRRLRSMAVSSLVAGAM